MNSTDAFAEAQSGQDELAQVVDIDKLRGVIWETLGSVLERTPDNNKRVNDLARLLDTIQRIPGRIRAMAEGIQHEWQRRPPAGAMDLATAVALAQAGSRAAIRWDAEHPQPVVPMPSDWPGPAPIPQMPPPPPWQPVPVPQQYPMPQFTDSNGVYVMVRRNTIEVLARELFAASRIINGAANTWSTQGRGADATDARSHAAKLTALRKQLEPIIDPVAGFGEPVACQ